MRRAVLFCSCLSLIAMPAAAEPSSQDRALAESLFREAKRLAKDGDYDEACPKFAESQRLDPQLGTLLHLATCHEQQGKTASAWAEYSAAVELAEKKGDEKRQSLAKKRAEALEPTLAKLEVVVEERHEGLAVSLDQRDLGEAALGSAVPIDPGRHQLRATAPGRESWSHDFEITSEAETTTVRIPQLAPLENGDDSGGAAAVVDDGATLRIAGYVATGLGGASLAIGGILGLMAASKRDDADAFCTGRLCEDRGLEGHDQARALAAGSTATFFIGLGFVTTGVTLMILGQPDDEPATARWQVAPLITSRGAALGARYRW